MHLYFKLQHQRLINQDEESKRQLSHIQEIRLSLASIDQVGYLFEIQCKHG